MVEHKFHPFPRLPTELRIRIWEMTIQPRIVEICCIHSGYLPRLVKTFSLTAPPATLHACQESRNHLGTRYQQIPLDRHLSGAPNESGQQYVWLNREMDTFDIGTSLLRCFRSAAPLIETLQLKRDNTDEGWSRWESEELRHFLNLKAVYMVCMGGDFEDWHAASEYPWTCGTENVFIVVGNQTMRLTEVEDKYDRLFEIAAREADPGSQVTFRNGNPTYPHGPRVTP